ncbi:hypothetical protein V8G56_03890 [Gaetbulibacter aquiaggeris]|uniref:Outer membrane protein beta-barrel domain-containing protein n=1 Tax=Gaetbulibacter aquiaggeris TaxID=1735373 RepID=A0ABW7MM19_9FLAO
MASYAQEANKEEVNKHHLALVFGYTHIPAAFIDGHSRESVYAPTIGFDYIYQFKERWAIGAVIDLEFANYTVDYNKEELERERPVITWILVGYELAPHWGIFFGPGVEFEKNKNLFILRASTEYTFEIGNGWGFFPAFNYDFKKEYSAWSLTFGISRRL